MICRLALRIGLPFVCVGCLGTATTSRDALLARAAAEPTRAYTDYVQLVGRYGFPIAHWPDSALADSLERAGAVGPCGPTQVLWVRRLTPVAPRYDLDRVVEYDESDIIGEWVIPANEVPRAIRGDALVLPVLWYPDSVVVDSATLPVLLVEPDGTLRLGKDARRIGWPSTEDCPDHAASARSDFWACHVFVDQRSGQRRRLAFNGICT